MHPDSSQISFYENANLVFTALFTIEAFIKIVAFGLIMNGKTSYLRKTWNQVDFFIVLVSLFEVFLQKSGSLSVIRVFRTLRILRPIRLVTRNQNLQIALTTIIKSLPKILKLQLLTSFFIVMLGIMQTHTYSGKFHDCHSEHLRLKPKQVD